MKTLKNRWIGLSMIVALAMVLAVGAACSETSDEDESETRGTLYLVDQDWNGQLVTTAVIQILLEQKMDHTVATKFAPADSAPLFIGLEKGDFHFVCCNWPSYSAALLEDYVDADDGAKVERVGPVGITGETGWYVPSYVINGDADRGIDAVAPNLRSVSDLNEYKSVFATSDTGTKGRLLEFTAAWDTKPAERLEAFGADFQEVFAGSEGAALAQVDAAFQGASQSSHTSGTSLGPRQVQPGEDRDARLDFGLLSWAAATTTAAFQPTPWPSWLGQASRTSFRKHISSSPDSR